MIPFSDQNPTRRFPLLTTALILACTGIFFLVQPTGKNVLIKPSRHDLASDLEFSYQYAAIPCEVTQNTPLTTDEISGTVNLGDQNACNDVEGLQPFPDKPVYLSLLYSMFMHGSILHLAGNMLFLWIFGNNIEDRQGKIRFGIFYLLAGLVGTVSHILIQPASTLPVIGASGAIAGVMGAYLILYPNARIRSLIFFGLMIIDIRAKWFLIFWFISQFFLNPNSGIAWMAHVSGFVFGIAVGILWLRGGRPNTPVESPRWDYGPAGNS